MSVEEHSQMLHERTFAAPLRTRVQGIAERGRPGQQIRNVPVEPTPGQQVGIGRNTGEIRVERRIDIATGQGVGPDGPVDALNSELGSSSPSPFTSWMRQEYNSDLMGQKGLRIYDKMRKSDGTVRGTLRLGKTPVLAVQCPIKPPSSNSPAHKIATSSCNNTTH